MMVWIALWVPWAEMRAVDDEGHRLPSLFASSTHKTPVRNHTPLLGQAPNKGIAAHNQVLMAHAFIQVNNLAEEPAEFSLDKLSRMKTGSVPTRKETPQPRCRVKNHPPISQFSFRCRAVVLPSRGSVHRQSHRSIVFENSRQFRQPTELRLLLEMSEDKRSHRQDRNGNPNRA